MGTHIDNYGRQTVSNPEAIVRTEMRAFADALEKPLAKGGNIGRQSDSTAENFYLLDGSDTIAFLMIEGSEVASHLNLVFTPQGASEAVTYRWGGTNSLWHLKGGTTSRSGGELLDELARLLG